jgi:hypothetical protein
MFLEQVVTRWQASGCLAWRHCDDVVFEGGELSLAAHDAMSLFVELCTRRLDDRLARDRRVNVIAAITLT